MPHDDCRSALALFVCRLCTHSSLDDEERAAIMALRLVVQPVRRHVDFVRLGETVEHACLVAEGLVGRFGQTADGHRQFVSLHLPGEMVDLPSVVLPQSTTALNALATTTIWKVPHNDLRDLGNRYPAIAAAFWRDCVLDARIVAQWLVNVGRRDARSRLANFLCELATRSRLLGQSDGRVFSLPMSQEQLGDALGLTAVHVNRTLGSLRNDRLVSFARGEVQILDPVELGRVGEFSPAYLGGAATPPPAGGQG